MLEAEEELTFFNKKYCQTNENYLYICGIKIKAMRKNKKLFSKEELKSILFTKKATGKICGDMMRLSDLTKEYIENLIKKYNGNK